MRRWGLFPRTLLLVGLLFLAITVATIAVSVVNLRENLIYEFESKGRAIAEQTAEMSVEILVNRDLSMLQAAIDQSLEIRGVAYVFVINADREIICHTFVPDVPTAVLGLPGDPNRITTGRVRLPGGPECIDVAAPILAGVGGYIHAGMDLSRINERVQRAILQQLAAISLVFGLSLLVTYYTVRRITKPLQKLTGFARQLATHDFASPFPHQEQLARLPEGSTAEVGSLVESFLFMETTIQESIERLRDSTAAKERIQGELQVARSIQMSFVPKKFPAYLHMMEFDIYATLEPSREVGGDLYDFFLLDESRLFMMIGDVSDKGVPAALFMAVTKTLIKAIAQQGFSLKETISRINNELCAENKAEMFVTAFAAVLHIKTGQLEVCNGGHNLPYLLSPDGPVQQLPRMRGMGLGVIEDVDFEVRIIQMEPRQTLVLYTDGVTEAQDPKENQYGEARLEKVLAEISKKSPREIVTRLVQEATDFAQGGPQADDITLLTMTYFGAVIPPNPPAKLELTIRSRLSELDRVTTSVEEFAQTCELNPKVVYALNLAVEELITNVVQHGYRDNGEESIWVKVLAKDKWVSLQVEDEAPPFNPFEEADEPDTELGIEDREIGGLGVHLIRKMFHEASYVREGGRNRVTLKLNM